MKIVVTGAAGYIGSHVVKNLLNKGHHVIAIDIKSDNIDQRAEYLNVNIFSQDKNIYEQIGRPEVCLHLAWRDGFAHNSQAHLEYLSSHYIFIRDLLEGGLKHIAVMGSMHEVGYFEGAVNENTPTNPLSLYGIAKNALRESTMLLCKQHEVKFHWLRAFYILGDDMKNHSIFTKICQMEQEGKKSFPFVSGKNKYDFLDVETLSEQIASTIIQTSVLGIVNCCSGTPISLAEKVQAFIKEHNFSIQPDFGKFPEREYDSPAIWGDNTKINTILSNHNE